MIMKSKAEALAQLDTILTDFRNMCVRTRDEDLCGTGETELVAFITRARAVIDRMAGRLSTYAVQADEIMSLKMYLNFKALQLAGVLQSLRSDVDADYLASQQELIHGELFSDFIELAQHLLSEGYKDPAAVIAGSSLEVHLRQLCHKLTVPVVVHKGSDVIPVKADTLNAELVKAGGYSKLDQKSVTAWLDLRNKAAHGNYQEYSRDQVVLMVQGIRDFITRNPA